MRAAREIVQNERGSIITLALLMLIILSMMAIYMSKTTTTDIMIAANDKHYATAFHLADSGVFAAGETVEIVKDLGRRPSIPTDTPTPATPEVLGLTVLDRNIDLELMEPTPEVLSRITATGAVVDAANDPGAGGEELDLRLELNGVVAEAAIWRELGSTHEPPGGSTEFGMGASGGSGGIVAVLTVNLNVVGEGPKGASAAIDAMYNYLQK